MTEIQDGHRAVLKLLLSGWGGWSKQATWVPRWCWYDWLAQSSWLSVCGGWGALKTSGSAGAYLATTCQSFFDAGARPCGLFLGRVWWLWGYTVDFSPSEHKNRAFSKSTCYILSVLALGMCYSLIRYCFVYERARTEVKYRNERSGGILSSSSTFFFENFFCHCWVEICILSTTLKNTRYWSSVFSNYSKIDFRFKRQNN